jgi:protein-S-isoprenylcysteine O-methyltransferase Ste14
MYETWLFVAASCLVCVAIRTVYERLKSVGRTDGRNKAIFTLVFLAMCGMLASWPIMCPFDPWHVALPAFVRWSCVGVAAAGLALAVGGLLQLRGVESIDHLVTGGLYAVLRHPMYTGFMLWIVGWGCCWGATGSLAVGIVCIGNILYWRHLEEGALEERYGDAYRRYRREMLVRSAWQSFVPSPRRTPDLPPRSAPAPVLAAPASPDCALTSRPAATFHP